MPRTDAAGQWTGKTEDPTRVSRSSFVTRRESGAKGAPWGHLKGLETVPRAKGREQRSVAGLSGEEIGVSSAPGDREIRCPLVW